MSLRPFASCALLLVACGGSTAPSGDRATAPLEPTTRDSAGVTLHEHPADALERAPLITMDSVPLAIHAGSVDSVDHDVSALSQFAFTSAGDLVAFDQQASQIVVLPANGEGRRAFGRPGGGPGELGGYGALVVTRGDTMVFNDASNDRLALISPTAGIVSELSLAGRGGGGASQPIGRGTNGAWFFQHWSARGSPGDQSGMLLQPITVQSWRGGADSLIDLFIGGELPIWREVRTITGGTSMMLRSAALTVEPQMRIWGDHILTSSGKQWVLEQRDTLGVVRGVIRVARPAEALTEMIWSRYVDVELARRISFDSTIERTAVRDQIGAETHGDSLPVISSVRVTPSQVAWAVDYRLPGDSGWAATAFDQRGRILGRIVDPAGAPPVAFGNDRLAFRTEDDDGIATITVRKLNLP